MLSKIKKKYIASGIIIFSIIVFIILVSPLFNKGIPMNIDAPCHYLREWCIKNVDSSIPNNWCSYWGAGIPSSQYYYPLADFLVFLGSFIFGLEISYKIIMILSLIVLGIGVFLLLQRKYGYLTGAIGFSFVILQSGGWHFGGFEETLLVGMWHYVFAVGMFFIFVSFLFKFFEKPSLKQGIITALFSMGFTHPYALVFAIFFISLFYLINIKSVIKNLKQHLLLIGSIIVLNVYYIIPLLFKIKYFAADLSGGIDWSTLNNYMIKQINIFVLIVALITFVFLCIKEYKEKSTQFFIISAIFLLLNFIPGKIHNLFLGVRFGAFIGPILYMFFAIGITKLKNISIKINKKHINLFWIIFIIFIICLVPVVFKTNKMSKGILLSSESYFKDAIDAYSYIKSNKISRLATEETLYNTGNTPYSFTHFHCIAPIFTNYETLTSTLIFFPKQDSTRAISAGLTKGYFLGLKNNNINSRDLKDRLEMFNIKYMLVHSPELVLRLYNHTDSVLEQKFGLFYLFKTNINDSFFEIINKEESKTIIKEESYEGVKSSITLDSSNLSRTVLMKSYYYPNWVIKKNNKELKAYECNSFVCFEDNGEKGTIKFEYKLMLLDILSYIISFIFLAFIIFILFRKKV